MAEAPPVHDGFARFALYAGEDSTVQGIGRWQRRFGACRAVCPMRGDNTTTCIGQAADCKTH